MLIATAINAFMVELPLDPTSVFNFKNGLIPPISPHPTPQHKKTVHDAKPSRHLHTTNLTLSPLGSSSKTYCAVTHVATYLQDTTGIKMLEQCLQELCLHATRQLQP